MKSGFDNLRIPISFSEKPTEDVALNAYLFSRSGKLLETCPVRGDTVEFKTTGVNPRLYRVLLAPANDRKGDAITSLAELESLKPYELVLDINREGFINPAIIPGDYSRLWLKRSCRVRGRVIKNFALGSIQQDRGICHARVHICEVDRILFWINRIPDRIIKRIPEIVVTPQWPIPIPEPDPEPFDPVFDPGVSGLAELNPQPLPPVASARRLFGFNATSEFAAPVELELQARISQLKSTPAELTSAQSAILASPRMLSVLGSGDVSSIRKMIVENFALFHPYFCHVHWLWPYFYRYDQVALTYTDMNGAFDVVFKYYDTGDKPDLYFWVEVLINGVWTTVYKPTIPCNTYWNYICGSAVTIRVTDPRVRWECNDIIEGDIVWIKTIGSAASVSHIQQHDVTTFIQGKNFNHIGLSDILNLGGISPNKNLSPFGSNLHFIVQFGSGLPVSGMYYYRWSYRKLRNADLSPASALPPASLHQGQDLFKPYTYEYYDALMHKHFGQNTFKLGPNSVNGQDDLYIIPPALPADSPVNAAELSPLWDQNTLTIDLDSTKLDEGLYEFIFELFDVNGNKLSALPKHLFQVPHYNSFAPSVDAPDINLLVNGATADGFKMKVRIDNAGCGANVYKIKVNGTEASSDCCGFVPYPPGADIQIAYRAYHPQNLATFGFNVQKGTCNDASQQSFTNASGMVIGNADGYTRDSFSIYRKDFSPAQLLGVCAAGGKAAFAEHLHVYALATNGYSRLTYLDASGLAAFALEPA